MTHPPPDGHPARPSLQQAPTPHTAEAPQTPEAADRGAGQGAGTDATAHVQDVSWREAPRAASAAAPTAAPTAQRVPLDDLNAPRRPSAAFMRAHPAHWIALGFGSGLSRIAPGTVGTLWAWLVWAALLHLLAPVAQGVLIAAAIGAAWWACTLTARHLRMADPSNIVADEIVAFWGVLWLIAPAGFWGQLVAFALFRFFDAVKPGPVGWADRLLHAKRGWLGGWGIVFDDLVAAFCTLFVIAAWRWWA